MIEKWLLVLAFILLSFGAGFVKGCSWQRSDAKESETVFLKTKAQIVEVEKEVEVPHFIQTVTTIHTESEKLVQEAKNETPNAVSCDFSPERLSRLRIAATGSP